MKATPGPWTPKLEEPRHYCHQCHTELDFRVKLQRADTCPGCGTDLHSCKNCRHWEAISRDRCSDPSGEFVRERDRANHCSAFAFAAGLRSEGDAAARSRAALAALFPGKP